LDACQEVARAFLNTRGDEVYHRVLAIVRRQLDSPLGYFGYIDDQGDLVVPSMTREVWQRCQIPDKSCVFPKAGWSGLCARSLLERRTFIANRGFRLPEGHLALSRALVAPVADGDKLVGQLVVANRDQDYQQQHAELLKTICQTIAPLLKARLRAEHLERERVAASEALTKARDELEARVVERTGELSEANRELEASQRSLARAQEIAHLGSWELDIPTGELRLSDEVYRIFGFEPGELQPSLEAFLRLVHPEDRSRVEQGLQRSLKEGEEYEVEHRILRRDGTVRHLHELGDVIPGDDGTSVGMIGTLLDVTRRHEYELELQRNADIQRSLRQLGALPQSCASLDEYLQRVAQQLSDFAWLPWQDAAGVFLYDEQRQELVPKRFRGRAGRPACRGSCIPLGRCLCGRAAEAREVVFSEHVDERHEFCCEDMRPHGHYCVPILRGESLLGLFTFHLGEGHQPEPWERPFLQSVADTLAAGIEGLRADEERRKLSLAAEQSADWIVITDPQGIATYANEAVRRISGYGPEELLGRKTSALRSGKHGQDFYRDMWSTISAGRTWRSLVENRARDGRSFLLDMTIQPLKDADDRITHYVSTGRDVTQEKAYEERLHRLANFDALTELPNRQLFVERLGQACARSVRQERLVAVVVLDLDRFKMLNESLGYQAGDEILREVPRRIGWLLREGDIIARLGADEYGIALVDVESLEDVVMVVEECLLGALRSPFATGEEGAIVSASIGITVLSDERAEPGQLLEEAYAALDLAKKRGGNGYVFHQPGMNAKVAEFMQIQRRLANALSGREFVLHYQPYVELAKGKPAGMEALLRWRQPDGSLVPPGRFIPVLEETGMIKEVGAWIIGEAAAQVGRWWQAGTPVVPVAVNLSPVQFRDQNLVSSIQEAVERAGIPPTLLAFENTESTFMDDIQHSQQVLRRIQTLGHAISVDDFGTGYSSLAYLKSLPVDALKIDMSFIRDLLSDPDSASIVTAIIQMAHSLDLKTIAEGVEDEQQYKVLRILRCDFAQGWYKARPTPAEEIEGLLRELMN